MPSDLVKAFPFLFYLLITSGIETRKERSSHTCKGRKRERKNDSQTQRPNPRHSGEIAPSSSQFALPISLSFSISLSLLNRFWSSQHCADRDLAFAPIVSIAIAAPRRAISPSPPPRDLASRQTQSPLSLPSSLNLTGFDDIFFWVLFVFLYWGMNDIIYLFGSWENMRKCEPQVENVFSMVFSRTKPNTRKYFSKHFLKCNQTLENIFLSQK